MCRVKKWNFCWNKRNKFCRLDLDDDNKGNISHIVQAFVGHYQCRSFFSIPSVFFVLLKKSKQMIYIWDNLHYTDCIHIWLFKHTNVSLFLVNYFVMCRPRDADTLIFYDIKSYELPYIKCCLFGSSQNWLLYFLLTGRVVLPCLLYESPFLKK